MDEGLLEDEDTEVEFLRLADEITSFISAKNEPKIVSRVERLKELYLDVQKNYGLAMGESIDANLLTLSYEKAFITKDTHEILQKDYDSLNTKYNRLLLEYQQTCKAFEDYKAKYTVPQAENKKPNKIRQQRKDNSKVEIRKNVEIKNLEKNYKDIQRKCGEMQDIIDNIQEERLKERNSSENLISSLKATTQELEDKIELLEGKLIENRLNNEPSLPDMTMLGNDATGNEHGLNMEMSINQEVNEESEEMKNQSHEETEQSSNEDSEQSEEKAKKQSNKEKRKQRYQANELAKKYDLLSDDVKELQSKWTNRNWLKTVFKKINGYPKEMDLRGKQHQINNGKIKKIRDVKRELSLRRNMQFLRKMHRIKYLHQMEKSRIREQLEKEIEGLKEELRETKIKYTEDIEDLKEKLQLMEKSKTWEEKRKKEIEELKDELRETKIEHKKDVNDFNEKLKLISGVGQLRNNEFNPKIKLNEDSNVSDELVSSILKEYKLPEMVGLLPVTPKKKAKSVPKLSIVIPPLLSPIDADTLFVPSSITSVSPPREMDSLDEIRSTQSKENSVLEVTDNFSTLFNSTEMLHDVLYDSPQGSVDSGYAKSRSEDEDDSSDIILSLAANGPKGQLSDDVSIKRKREDSCLNTKRLCADEYIGKFNIKNNVRKPFLEKLPDWTCCPGGCDDDYLAGFKDGYYVPACSKRITKGKITSSHTESYLSNVINIVPKLSTILKSKFEFDDENVTKAAPKVRRSSRKTKCKSKSPTKKLSINKQTSTEDEFKKCQARALKKLEISNKIEILPTRQLRSGKVLGCGIDCDRIDCEERYVKEKPISQIKRCNTTNKPNEIPKLSELVSQVQKTQKMQLQETTFEPKHLIEKKEKASQLETKALEIKKAQLQKSCSEPVHLIEKKQKVKLSELVSQVQKTQKMQLQETTFELKHLIEKKEKASQLETKALEIKKAQLQKSCSEPVHLIEKKQKVKLSELVSQVQKTQKMQLQETTFEPKHLIEKKEKASQLETKALEIKKAQLQKSCSEPVHLIEKKQKVLNSEDLFEIIGKKNKISKSTIYCDDTSRNLPKQTDRPLILNGLKQLPNKTSNHIPLRETCVNLKLRSNTINKPKEISKSKLIKAIMTYPCFVDVSKNNALQVPEHKRIKILQHIILKGPDMKVTNQENNDNKNFIPLRSYGRTKRIAPTLKNSKTKNSTQKAVDNSVSMETPRVFLIKDDLSNTQVRLVDPPKKNRIAHTPKHVKDTIDIISPNPFGVSTNSTKASEHIKLTPTQTEIWKESVKLYKCKTKNDNLAKQKASFKRANKPKPIASLKPPITEEYAEIEEMIKDTDDHNNVASTFDNSVSIEKPRVFLIKDDLSNTQVRLVDPPIKNRIAHTPKHVKDAIEIISPNPLKPPITEEYAEIEEMIKDTDDHNNVASTFDSFELPKSPQHEPEAYDMFLPRIIPMEKEPNDVVLSEGEFEDTCEEIEPVDVSLRIKQKSNMKVFLIKDDLSNTQVRLVDPPIKNRIAHTPKHVKDAIEIISPNPLKPPITEEYAEIEEMIKDTDDHNNVASTFDSFESPKSPQHEPEAYDMFLPKIIPMEKEPNDVVLSEGEFEDTCEEIEPVDVSLRIKQKSNMKVTNQENNDNKNFIPLRSYGRTKRIAPTLKNFKTNNSTQKAVDNSVSIEKPRVFLIKDDLSNTQVRLVDPPIKNRIAHTPKHVKDAIEIISPNPFGVSTNSTKASEHTKLTPKQTEIWKESVKLLKCKTKNDNLAKHKASFKRANKRKPIASLKPPITEEYAEIEEMIKDTDDNNVASTFDSFELPKSPQHEPEAYDMFLPRIIPMEKEPNDVVLSEGEFEDTCEEIEPVDVSLRIKQKSNMKVTNQENNDNKNFIPLRSYGRTKRIAPTLKNFKTNNSTQKAVDNSVSIEKPRVFVIKDDLSNTQVRLVDPPIKNRIAHTPKHVKDAIEIISPNPFGVSTNSTKASEHTKLTPKQTEIWKEAIKLYKCKTKNDNLAKQKASFKRPNKRKPIVSLKPPITEEYAEIEEMIKDTDDHNNVASTFDSFESPKSPQHELEAYDMFLPRIISMEKDPDDVVLSEGEFEDTCEEIEPVDVSLRIKQKREMRGKLKQLLLHHKSNGRMIEIIEAFVDKPVDLIVREIFKVLCRDKFENAKCVNRKNGPVLTTIQQLMFGFMMLLEERGVKVMEHFLTEVEHHMFSVDDIIQLTPYLRVHTAICKMKFYYARMRMLFCRVLAEMDNIPIPYILMTVQSWHKVIPKNEIYKSSGNPTPIELRAFTQAIRIRSCNDYPECYKNLALLLTGLYYQYPTEREDTGKLLEELFETYLKNNSSDSLTYLIQAICKYSDAKLVFNQLDKVKLQLRATMNVDEMQLMIRLISIVTSWFSSDSRAYTYVNSNKEFLNQYCTDLPSQL